MMVERKGINEEDILITEAMIAESYGRLKLSLKQAQDSALRTASRTFIDHPLAAAGTAGMGGMLGTIVLGMLQPQVTRGKNASEGNDESRPNLTGEILAGVLPIATPYIARIICDYLNGMPTKGGHSQD